MIHKQRFFERTDGGTPLAYGYSRRHDSDEGPVREFAMSLPGVKYSGMVREYSLEAKHKPFSRRPAARELMDKLQPGDHLVVGQFIHIPSSVDDFANTGRWLIEHGVQLHVLDLTALISPEAATAMCELYRDLMAERIRDARARGRAGKLHGGGGVPAFCQMVGQAPGKKCGAGGRLEFQPWAMPMFERIVHLHDVAGLGWFQMAGQIWREFKRYGIKQPHPTRYKHYYDFYKGWQELGCPDINEIKVMEVRENYRSKRLQDKKKQLQPLPEDGCL